MTLRLSTTPDINEICLIGKMRSGKDTLGRYLCDTYGYRRYAFGDELKRCYHEVFGYGTDNLRQACQWFGQAMREYRQDVWVDRVFDRIAWEMPDKIVITDCRQPNEYKRAVEEHFLIVRIDCDEQTRIKRMEQAGDVFTLENLHHETETALDGYPVHFTVSNMGTVEEMIYLFEQSLSRYR